MSRILLNSQVLNDLIATNMLTFQTKFKRGDGKNYFLIPNVGIKLYNAKVSWIDPSKKNLSFCFNRYENLSLLTMLQYIDSRIVATLKDKTSMAKNVAPFYFVKGDYFYIRCYMPNTQRTGTYNITSYFNNNLEPFDVPRILSVYSAVIIDIRNIWEDNDRAGYNLELKEVSLDI